MDLCKLIQRLHFTHQPSPHTTPSAFPHQPEWQAYEQMRAIQPHNGGFVTLFYKALYGVDDYIGFSRVLKFTSRKQGGKKLFSCKNTSKILKNRH